MHHELRAHAQLCCSNKSCLPVTVRCIGHGNVPCSVEMWFEEICPNPGFNLDPKQEALCDVTNTSYVQHQQLAEESKGSVRDVPDGVEGKTESPQLCQSAQSTDGNLRQDVFIQPQVTQRPQASEGGDCRWDRN